MTTVSKVDGRIISYVKGSPECVLAMCGISGEERKKAEAAITNAEENAMRVIAFAHKKLDGMRDYEEEKEHTQMESNMVFDGFVAISDPLRADVYDAVKCCRSAGVGVKILTGDNIITASAIASELDLLGKGKVALEAKEIEEMSDDELCNILPQISVIARSTPSVKMRIVKLLKSQGNVVAVTGDGINDAPVLAQSDVGVAMGGIGSDVAIEAADVVIMSDSLSKLPVARKIAKKTMNIVHENIIFSIAVKVLIIIGCAIGIFNENAMWLAVFGDVGVCLIAVANALRAMHVSKKVKKNNTL